MAWDIVDVVLVGEMQAERHFGRLANRRAPMLQAALVYSSSRLPDQTPLKSLDPYSMSLALYEVLLYLLRTANMQESI